ncbi:MAG TPA: clan AA aspartic protease [Tepidisphaeraceae bacterium]|nr:clan AA aspartic protease [Tepidisphaeraceae bacterium]
MGHVRVDIRLSNPREPSLQPVTVNALVDTGATVTCLPQRVADQLKLTPLEARTATVADGRSVKADYAGPIKIEFENRMCFTGALVFGDDVLLGAVAVEDMDLIIDMRNQRLAVPPDRPNFAQVLVKRV